MRSRMMAMVVGILTVFASVVAISNTGSATPDDNNDFNQAVEVFNNDVYLEEVDDTDDLDDYYTIYLEAGDDLYVSLEVPTDQDFDLYLYSPTLDLLDYSQIDNPSTGIYEESVSWTAVSTGYYYIDVYAFYGAGYYLLWITATAEWTIMVYLDGDNNLEGNAIDDFLEMSNVGSSSEVNIVVQFDRWDGSPNPADDTRYGDWTGCERFLVTSGMTPTLAESDMSLGEVNMGDPQTLVDFGDSAILNFPANHYALVLWDHGGQWTGLCNDDSSGDVLTMSELSTALDTIVTDNSMSSIDIVWFDACLMASIEVADQISPYCDYMVGSEDLEPGTGANYDLTLSALVADPLMTPQDLAAQVVSDFIYSYDDTPETGYEEADVTQSASYMSYVHALVDSVDALATELETNMSALVNYVMDCWEMAERYPSDPYYHPMKYVDLYDLASGMAQYVPSGEVRTLAEAVMDAVNATILSYGFWDAPGGGTIENAHGLTVYFPDVLDYDSSYALPGCQFTADTMWDEFLNTLWTTHSLLNLAPSFVTVDPVTDPTIDEGQSQTFSVSAIDLNGNTISYFWYLDGVVVDAVEGATSIAYTPNYSAAGTHTIEIEIWDGEYSDSVIWDVTVDNVDIVDPTSHVNPIAPYWQAGSSVTVTSTATDTDGPIAEVSLEYRFSSDNVTFGSWTGFDTDYTSPWSWDFDFPDGNGYYEFYSYAVDEEGNGEVGSATAEATCAYDGTPPTAVFTVDPAVGNTSTWFDLDASGCTDFKDPTSSLQIRWDAENDGTWDSAWSSVLTWQIQYPTTGTYTLKMAVKDTDGLVNETTMQVVVGTNPVASFSVLPTSGDTSTDFAFDASGSSDAEDLLAGLQVRWDWENDGTWDTLWTGSKTANHQFLVAGDYTVRLEVKDSSGLISSTTMTVVVQEVVIPEFGAVLLPILGCIGVVVWFGKSRRKTGT